jgi:hypothetical protein
LDKTLQPSETEFEQEVHMNSQTARQIATVLISLSTLMAPIAGNAEHHSKSKQIVVLEPADLPETAQTAGDSLFLRTDHNGVTYLYIEQRQGARLAILDVADPAHIKPVSIIPLDAAGVFDFVRPLNDRAELIRYRQTGGIAVLDLAKAKNPSLRTLASLSDSATVESLGMTGLLATNAPNQYVASVPRDFQVIDISSPHTPAVLTTVKQVEQRVENDETGTTFLLGNEGLTVIRQPGVEEDHLAQERQLDQN